MAETNVPNLFNPEHLFVFKGDGNLSFPGHMTHVIDSSTGIEYLHLEDIEITPYPSPSPEDMLDDLVLPMEFDDKGERYVTLPSEYKTLAQALHDIAGEETDPEELFADGAARDHASALFIQVGDQLNWLIEGDGIIPVSIEARQILVIPTDQEGAVAVRLLPPLPLLDTKDIANPAIYRDRFLRSLYNSCHYTVQSKPEQDILPAAFKSFADAFAYGKSHSLDEEAS